MGMIEARDGQNRCRFTPHANSERVTVCPARRDATREAIDGDERTVMDPGVRGEATPFRRARARLPRSMSVRASPLGAVGAAALPGRSALIGGSRWQVRLLGAVQATDGAQRIDRFPSRAVAALLARLALQPHRAHAREELVDLLWPGVALDVGRNRLRQALSTLKSLLEPPDQPGVTVVQADRVHLRVVPGALDCDARRFAHLVQFGRDEEARALYGGELMPGFYADWIEEERRHLDSLHSQVTERIRAGSGPARSPAAAPVPGGLGTPASGDPVPSRLPDYLTRLFGVKRQAAQLRTQVLAHRLVTLLGPGGSGKTRLAVEIATSLREAGDRRSAPGVAAPADRPFDCVAFVPLVSCSDAAQAAAAIAAALRLPSSAGGQAPVASMSDRLAVALDGRRVLLVLDNVEQLVGAIERLLAELLERLPGLRLLVTSRRALGIDGERCMVVQPLAVPQAGACLERAAASPAVALFVDRARAARTDFHLSQRNSADVVGPVRALCGMPLAIELAAARVRSYAPREMLQQLQAASTVRVPGGATPGLDLLARQGRRSGTDSRHASMRRTIDWSWWLLTQPEQSLLCALTVFCGGCTAQAVRALTGRAEGADAGALHLRLDALVSHSLVVAAPAGGARRPDDLRFLLYEPIREFAAAQLSESAATVWRARHRQWMLHWSKALATTPDLAEVRAEQPNLEAALASALADGRPGDAVELLLRLRRVLEDVELPVTAMPYAEAAVAACPDPLLKSRGHSLLGPLLLLAGRRDATVEAARIGLASLPEAADPALRARALHALARVVWRSQRDAARALALIDTAEPLAGTAADLDLQAGLLALRAFICNATEGDHDRAHALHAQALALWQQQGNRHAVHSGLYNLAVTQQQAGRNGEVLELLGRLRASARELHDWRRLSQADNVAGNALCDLHRWPQAASSLRDALRLAWETMAPYELAYPLWNLPRALAHLRQPERALQLAAFAAAYWERGFGKLTKADRRDLLRVRRLCARQLDGARLAAAWAEGGTLELADAVALALQP